MFNNELCYMMEYIGRFNGNNTIDRGKNNAYYYGRASNFYTV